MGCDIHTFVERRGNDGAWRPTFVLKPPELGWTEEVQDAHRASTLDGLLETRCYVWFALLASVRGNYDGPAIAADRGLPEDVTHQARAWMEDNAEYGLSWVGLEELEAFEWGDWGVRCGHIRDIAIPLLRWVGEGDEVRIIFGFDN